VELAKDVRTFLGKHQGMNATPAVFAAQYARLIAADQSEAAMPASDRPHKDRGRGR
jgi:type IV secretion system T-DNA border endonuclease VirD2